MKATRKRTKKPAAPLGLQALFSAMQTDNYRSYYAPTTPGAFVDIPTALSAIKGDSFTRALEAAADREFVGAEWGPDGTQRAHECAGVYGLACFWAGVAACWHYMNAINGKGGAS